MNFKLKIKEKIYDITIDKKDEEKVDIKVNDKIFSFSNASEEEKFLVSEFGRNQKKVATKEVKASLGGIVSEIFIQEGVKVQEGDKLLTLLAMKMENEIVSESEGVVKKILVKPDQTVKEGELLIIFE